jgi:hypothetical protein
MGNDRQEIPRDRQQVTGDSRRKQLPRALAVACSLLSVACLLSGCGNIEPWVKPYERQQLADPIMAFDANPVSKAYMDHVFEAREGARGGLGSAGGGCGCN